MATATTVRISLYKTVHHNDAREIEIITFLEKVRDGEWQDQVFQVRNTKTTDERKALKKTLPAVTVSGMFGANRRMADLKKHSGYLALDFDDLGQEVEGYRALLNEDPYVYSCFTSCSGTGLCAIIPIDPTKHREAFAGLAEYMHTKYQLIVDPQESGILLIAYLTVIFGG